MNFRAHLFALCIFVMLGLNSLSAQDFKEIHKSFTLDQQGKVTLDTYKGKITIEPSNGDVVDVYVKIVPDREGFLSTSVKQQLANANVVFENSSNSVKIKSDYKHGDDSWFGGSTRAFTNYVIKMPKTARLTVKDYKSETNISGLESTVEFETYKGEVKIYGLVGAIDFETYKGEAKIKFAKLTGDSHFNSYKGEISVYLPKNSAFSFNSDFEKRVDFDNDFNISSTSSSRKHKSYNFSGDVNGGGPLIKMSGEKGNFELRAE